MYTHTLVKANRFPAHCCSTPTAVVAVQVHGFDASQLGTFTVTAAELPGASNGGGAGAGGRGADAGGRGGRGGRGGPPGWDDADCVPVRSAMGSGRAPPVAECWRVPFESCTVFGRQVRVMGRPEHGEIDSDGGAEVFCLDAQVTAPSSPPPILLPSSSRPHIHLGPLHSTLNSHTVTHHTPLFTHTSTLPLPPLAPPFPPILQSPPLPAHCSVWGGRAV